MSPTSSSNNQQNKNTSSHSTATRKRRARSSSTGTSSTSSSTVMKAACGLGLLCLAAPTMPVAMGFLAPAPAAPGCSGTGTTGVARRIQQQWRTSAAPFAPPADGVCFASKLEDNNKTKSKARGGLTPGSFDPLALVQKKQASSSSTSMIEKSVAALEGETTTVEGEEELDNSKYKAMLLVVALLWGSNFGALKYLDTCGVDVSLLTCMRFALASTALLPFLWGKGLDILKAGLEVGLWVTLGYVTQAIGLETTDASKSAFICSLTVVVVPLIQGLLGKKISPSTWGACALAVFGVGLLTLQGTSGPVIGDLWSMGQPLGFGIAFMRIEHYMKKFPGKAIPLAAAQMLSVFGISTLWAALNTDFFQNVGDLSILMDPAHMASLFYTGLISSALAVVIESAALEYVSSEDTSIIFSTEPLFAAATSAIVLGERLKPSGMLGGFAILSACLLSQLDVTSLAAVLPMLSKVADDTDSTGTGLK